jgi:hypothetical protein
MTDNGSQSIWNKYDTYRSKLPYGSEAKLLIEDYASGDFKLFTKDEYQSEEFKEFATHLVNRTGMGNRIASGSPYTPKDINRLVLALLVPGKTLNLFSRYGELTRGVEYLGVEPNQEMLNYCRLINIGNEEAVTLVADDPTTWRGDAQFENVVTIPPFGIKGDFDNKLAEAINDSTSDQAVLIIPEGFLYGDRQKKIREFYKNNFSIEAIISLPSGTFSPYTAIKTSLIVMRKTTKIVNTLFIEVEDLSELNHVIQAVQDLREGRRPKLGFLAEVDTADRWDYKYHEPIDNTEQLKNLPYSNEVKILEEVASFSVGKKEDSSQIALNKTGSNIKKADDHSVNEKNSIFITFNESIDPDYFLAFLHSEIGANALSKIVKGSTIPYISVKDLGLLEIIVPELEIQVNIASAYKEMEALSEKLISVIDNTKKSFESNPFIYESLNANLKGLYSKAEESYSQLLPFPIAIVNRKLDNAQTYKDKYTILVELFESLIKYTALINVSDYLNRLNMGEDPGMGLDRLQRPALGDWVNIFFALTKLKNQPDAQPFLSELKDVRLNKYAETFHKVIKDRNDLLGHGAAMPDLEYRRHFDDLRPIITETIDLLGFVYKYKLAKPTGLTYDDDSFSVEYYDLMGDNSHFSIQTRQTSNPIKTDAVLIMREDGGYLNLDPFIVLEECQTCMRLELLFFDKFDKNGITYLSFETGHKSTLQKLDQLPGALRDMLKS